jgi:hypothetical protein
VKSQPDMIPDRAYALATCPARAPDPWAGPAPRRPRRDTERRRELDEAIRVAEEFLSRLAAVRRGYWWLDSVNSRVVVQVTADEDSALEEMRALVADADYVAVELVRYSGSQLEAWAQKIIAMDDIGWSSVGFENPNNRIEVKVQGRADEAWQRIARVVEPCAFRVEGGIGFQPVGRG